jgi:hypothetical protein
VTTATAASPSRAALRREERRTYREVRELGKLLNRLDAAGASDEMWLEANRHFLAASRAHFAAIAALNAARDPGPPEPPAGPAARLRLVREPADEYRALHQDACALAVLDADESVDEPVPLFGWAGSVEAANYDAALLAGACPLDLYDLHDDGREPW